MKRTSILTLSLAFTVFALISVASYGQQPTEVTNEDSYYLSVIDDTSWDLTWSDEEEETPANKAIGTEYYVDPCFDDWDDLLEDLIDYPWW